MLYEKAVCQGYALKVYALFGMPKSVDPIDPITCASHTIRNNAKTTQCNTTECTCAARLPIHLQLERDQREWIAHTQLSKLQVDRHQGQDAHDKLVRGAVRWGQKDSVLYVSWYREIGKDA